MISALILRQNPYDLALMLIISSRLIDRIYRSLYSPAKISKQWFQLQPCHHEVNTTILTAYCFGTKSLVDFCYYDGYVEAIPHWLE